jgi:G:T-mismatch repair DNA endonuclease (very short patch repair protein)
MNQRRDRRTNRKLRALGWSVIRIWECALAKQPEVCVHRIRDALNVTRSEQFVAQFSRCPTGKTLSPAGSTIA